jgi:hypothetical protein
MKTEVGELRPTPVDLEELASHLEGPTDVDEGWMLEIATGRLWPRDPVGMAGIDESDDFDDPEAFAAVIGLGSGPGYGDMRDFIGTVTDDALAGRLGVAIQGKGAFRRFKDTLFPARGLVGPVADVLERAAAGPRPMVARRRRSTSGPRHRRVPRHLIRASRTCA